MSLSNILGKPEYIAGVGDIYPIKVKDYDKFIKYSSILLYSKQHFNESEHPLLDLVVYGIDEAETTSSLEKLFSMVLRKDVTYLSVESKYGFLIDEDHAITSSNYDLVREVIMRQNVMHEQKVFKDPLVRSWAEKVLAARSKNAAKMSLEDMVTTVSVFKGVPYDVIAEQTYYQLYADFLRIRKFKSHDMTVQFRCVSNEVEIENYDEEVNMYKNPYDDLFVNSGKLDNLNNAMK